MSEKKKFKDTGVGKFLLDKIPNGGGAIAGDTPVGSVIQAIIGGSDMSDADKQIALEKLKMERAEIDGTTKRWVADARSGNWLASNVRPLVLVFVMGAFSIWHWIIVLIIVLLLFGKGKIPTLMGDMAKGIKSFKKNMSDEDNASASDSDKDSSNKAQ